MKLFAKYLEQRRRLIYVFLLYTAVFLVSFMLYHLPPAAVLYPSSLCLGISLVLLAADFRRVCAAHASLSGVGSPAAVTPDALPATDDVLDADYQQIIRLLCEEAKTREDAASARFTDMVDYYTVWAHQIKTPIASMRLTLSGEDSALSRTLSGELSRIEQYVEMVLMFLRLDSDSTDYVIRECSLDGIVRQAVRKFAGEFINRRLSLNYGLSDTTVLTDEKWLSFVIEQVLSNALKYTREGGISITLESPKTLCISDTGIGIAPEDLPRIFEKGFTGYNGRGDMKASGIGLYLCRRICRNLGHSISAESEPGRGTVIRIGLYRDRLEVE